MHLCVTQLVGLLLAGFFSPLLMCVSVSAADDLLVDEARNAAVTSLRSLWEGHRSEVVTAQIEYLFFTFSCDEQPVTPQEFRDWLEETQFLGNEGLSREVVDRFYPDLATKGADAVEKQLQNMLDHRSLTVRGLDRRSFSRRQEHVVTDELHLFVDRLNSDVRAFNRGSCPYWAEDFNWFRPIPPEEVLDSAIIEREGDLLRVTSVVDDKPASWLTVDPDTGLIHRREWIDAETDTLTRMEFCGEPTIWPGNIVVPAVRIQANIRNGKVGLVLISIIENARFNIDLDDEAFVLTGAQGWAWFDWRTEDHRGGRWPKPIRDVAAFFRNQSSSPAVAPKHFHGASLFSWRLLMLFLNGGGLITLGVYLWRRSA